MPTETKKESEKKDFTAIIIAGFFFLLQFVLFMYNYNFLGYELLIWTGWLLLIPGFILISLSMSRLKESNILEEASTSTFCTKGVYEIVRHPLSLGWILLAVGFTFISQYWLSLYCLIIQLPLIVFDVICEEEFLEKKFDGEYRRYQDTVPMMNIFSGVSNYYRRFEKSSSETS